MRQRDSRNEHVGLTGVTQCAPPATNHDALGAVDLEGERRRTERVRAGAKVVTELRSERRLFPGEQIGPLQRALLEPRLKRRLQQHSTDRPPLPPPPPALSGGLSFTSNRHSIEALERFLVLMQ